jgi:hypothetical protein
MADSDFLRIDRVNERLAEGADPIRGDAGTIVSWKRNIYSYRRSVRPTLARR